MPSLGAFGAAVFFLAYACVAILVVFLVVRSLVRMSESLREISATLTEISASLRTRNPG
jgi:hypothetical protein